MYNNNIINNNFLGRYFKTTTSNTSNHKKTDNTQETSSSSRKGVLNQTASRSLRQPSHHHSTEFNSILFAIQQNFDKKSSTDPDTFIERRDNAKMMDALLHHTIKEYHSGTMSRKELLIATELLWCTNARAYKKIDGMSLKRTMESIGLNKRDVDDVMKIIRRSRNSSAPIGYVKPLSFHGSPKYIKPTDDGTGTLTLGLGLMNDRSKGFDALANKVFLAGYDLNLMLFCW